jgi:hypothetical protein
LIFRYVGAVIYSPFDGLPDAASRPEIPLVIRGPAGEQDLLGLVDTGSDLTIFPKSVADDLGIALTASPGRPVVGFSGHPTSLLIGRAAIRIEQGSDVIGWEDDLLFHDSGSTENEPAILGHIGFLEFFTATFDGANGILTLTDNGLSP